MTTFTGSPNEVVGAVFTTAHEYAEANNAAASTFINALNDLDYSAPTVSVTWNDLAAPNLPDIDPTPTMDAIVFNTPTGLPTGFSEPAPTVTIDDFTEEAPTLTLPSTPTISYDSAPTVPEVADVALPAAPTPSLPAAPGLLTVNTVAFSGIDLQESWLDALDTIPTLTLVSPTAYSYTPGATYESEMLTGLKNVLQGFLAAPGGAPPATGLPDTIEQALWDRARTRETQINLGAQAEIARSAEALGFALPSGAVAEQQRQADRDYYSKLSEFSRDVAIKQSELEQGNWKFIIEQGFALESKLIDYSWLIETRTFESAKVVAENAVARYNAEADGFKALLAGYAEYRQAYQAIIAGQQAKVDAYKAQLEAERNKTEINAALVDQYKAQIEAEMAAIEVYKAQLGGARALVEIEQAKVAAAGERVRAYTAQVNAETAKVEAFKAGVQGQEAILSLYQVRADVFSKKVAGQGEKARAELARYQALAASKAAEWDIYRAKVTTEAERIRALGLSNAAKTDAYKAGTQAVIASAEIATTVWKGQIANYEASKQVALTTAKVNAEAYMTTRNAQMEAAKVGAQCYAQLAASSYSMMRADVGISARSDMGVNYNYSGDVNSDVSPVTTA